MQKEKTRITVHGKMTVALFFCVLLLCVAPPFNVSGDDAQAAAISADSQSAAIGDLVTFTISLTDTPNDVFAFLYTIGYDERVLLFYGYARGEVLQGFGMNSINGYPSLNGVVTPGYAKAGGFSISPIPAGATGTMYTITFRVIGPGSCVIDLRYLKDDMSGWDIQDGYFMCQSAGHPNMVDWNGKLVADFGDNGLWYHDGTQWNWMSNRGHVNRMTTWNDNLVVDFGADGIHYYDGTWHWMTNKGNVSFMQSWDNGTTEMLVADFGGGRRMYTYDGAWHWLSNKDTVADMHAWDGRLVVDFGRGRGVYNYDGSWHWMSNKAETAQILTWNNGATEKLVVDFGGGRGVYTYDGTWRWLSNKDDVNAMAVWDNRLVIDFGAGRGMYNYSGSWNWMTGKDDVARLATWKDGVDKLAVDFGNSRGIYYYNNGAWHWMKNASDVPEMVPWGNRLAVDLGTGVGIYNYNGSWNYMRTMSTEE